MKVEGGQIFNYGLQQLFYMFAFSFEQPQLNDLYNFGNST